MTAKLRRRWWLTFGIGGSMVFFGGCTSESETTGGISIQNFPAAFADALCNNIGPCCEREGFVHDAASCRAKTEAVLGLEAGRAQTKGTPFDPTGARACIETVAALARSCSADNTEALVNAACIRVYAGNQPEGATCTSGFQCASGDCVTSFERPSQCGPPAPVRGKIGDGCSETCYRDSSRGTVSCTAADPAAPMGASRCFDDDDMFCDRQTRVCTAKGDIGQACAPSLACRSGAFCEEGVCAWKRTSGPCADSAACDATAYCGYTVPRQCVLRMERGERCGFDEQCAATDDCAQTCRGRTLASTHNCM